MDEKDAKEFRCWLIEKGFTEGGADQLIRNINEKRCPDRLGLQQYHDWIGEFGKDKSGYYALIRGTEN